MNRFALALAFAPSVAFALGCGPIAHGGEGTGGSGDPLMTTSATASSSGAGGSADPAGSGGNSGPIKPPGPVGDPPPSCSACSAALFNDDAGELCAPSQTTLSALLQCACTTACAAVCGNGAAGNCLDSWGGNVPVECQTCLMASTGCGSAWNACLTDDGNPGAPPGSSTSGGGNACSCDPALPLCPGGGSCSAPGAQNQPGNEACGTAEYCAPCCDPGDACAVQGSCQITKISGATCSADYECCSGVCTDGACVGGCGVVLGF